MSSAPHYSPVQILSMGRQAEAEGNLDYALKVYAHLIEHYADTPEHADAVQGQRRILAWRQAEEARRIVDRAQTTGGRPGQPVPEAGVRPSARGPADPGGVAEAVRADKGRGEMGRGDISRGDISRGDISRADMAGRPPPNAKPPPLVSAPDPAARPPIGDPSRAGSGPAPRPGIRAGQPVGMSAPQVPPGARGQEVAPVRSAPQEPGPAPQVRMPGLSHDEPGLPRLVVSDAAHEAYRDINVLPPRRYRIGSALAGLFAILGWMAVAAGLALVMITFSSTFAALSAAGPFGFPIGFEGGLVAIWAGLFVVFVSQVAAAIFDAANATQALVAMEQSRGYHEY